MSSQVSRVLLESGALLADALSRRIGWEPRPIVQDERPILERSDKIGGDVWRERPLLRAADWPVLFSRAASAAFGRADR